MKQMEEEGMENNYQYEYDTSYYYEQKISTDYQYHNGNCSPYDNVKDNDYHYRIDNQSPALIGCGQNQKLFSKFIYISTVLYF